ncbi:MAG: COX15/CtaA family protein [Wenzhouxiangella sp.]
MFNATTAAGNGKESALSAQSTNERLIGIWLLVCCAVLLALILLGGATRLTGSGLSMVHWQPLNVVPPITETAWLEEFEAYRQSPEYQMVNRGMALDEFKVIFWYEFGHRLLARGLGLVFALPLVWFLWRRMVPARLRWPLFGLLALGGAQGYMGWYMVQSGLVDIPRVSPYRLAAHLGLALVIFAIMLRMAVDLLWSRPSSNGSQRLRRGIRLTLALTAVTIVSGAFVAGLKAGLVYNTFPLMGGRVVPEGVLGLEPLWRNFFENPATVQFIHRVLAISTLGAVVALWWRGRRLASGDALRRSFNVLIIVALGQVGLGIATLLMYVPDTIGTIHQGGAVVLLTTLLVVDWLAHSPQTARNGKPDRPVLTGDPATAVAS